MGTTAISIPVPNGLANFIGQWQLPFWAVAGGIVGILGWGWTYEVWPLLVLMALPVLWGLAPSRSAAAVMMLAYYLAASRGLPPGAVVFFGDDAPSWWGWAMWMASSVLLSIPYAVLWTKAPRLRALLFVGAILCTLLPPLGFIGWVSPLAVAGLLFPGLSWLGLAMALCLFVVLATSSRFWTCGLIVCAVAINLVGTEPPPAKVNSSWKGQDTHFLRLAGAGWNDAGQRLDALKRLDWVNEYAVHIPANSIRVLPETILGPFDGIAEFALQDTEKALQVRGSRLVVGAELPQTNGKYKNAVVVLGAKDEEDRTAVQGIPVPVSMWKPWAIDGAMASPFGHQNSVVVEGRRVVALVCYEQLLAYSHFWAMLEKPEVVVAVSNVWWARETSIPAIQGQMVGAFSRLFGVEAVTAKNI